MWTDSMNFIMLPGNRTTPVFIILSENRPIFFGAYPSHIPVRTQALREDGTMLNVPSEIRPNSDRILKKGSVPIKYHSHCHKWLRYYPDFCCKYVVCPSYVNSVFCHIFVKGHGLVLGLNPEKNMFVSTTSLTFSFHPCAFRQFQKSLPHSICFSQKFRQFRMTGF